VTSIIDWAIEQQNRKAGADRSADVMRLTLATIAGSGLTSSQRLALITELELCWQAAGLV
jgi:hypothetical protein